MTSPMKLWKWYRVPVTVFSIGLLSIILLYAIHQIRVQQRQNTALNDAILHIEVNTAIFHLQTEELLAGEPTVNIKDAFARLDQAIRLAYVILSGKEIDSDQGSVSGIVKTLGLQTRTQELKTLLTSLRETALWRLEDVANRGIASAADRQFDAQFDEILEKAMVFEEICKKNRNENLHRSLRVVLSIYFVWALVVITATLALGRVEMRRKAAEESLLQANEQLFAQAEELAIHRENLSGLVEKRTSELSAANRQLRLEIAERLKAEETLRESEMQIRHLSSQLLTAQEIERRRISMELHDGLGQALNVMKLRIWAIKNGLGEAHGESRADCEELSGYLDEVIEDVRRLSLDLSPAVIEDLGLTSALRWLASNFSRNFNMEVTVDIAEIDDLFSENNRITAYRVVQEALANAGKHSRAGKVAIVIRIQEDRVAFSIEDDGQGFDLMETAMKNAHQKGLGLTTMNERVRMMGGVFDLWSRMGEGTRINFSIPVGNQGA